MVSFKEAALNILDRADEPLTTQEITDIAIQERLIETDGLTPAATMGAQLYNDIKNNNKSPFTKIGKGRFALKNKNDSVSSPLILIEKHNKNVKNALEEKLLNMDSFLFEHFIADLLKKIGYEDVNVTKRSGDGGIDIIANLTVGGITNVKTVIQVKRYNVHTKISGKVITQLRGSAEVDQRGLVITTSDFTEGATSESKAPNKMPVALINGEKLIKLLFEYGVGVKIEEKTIYSLDTDYFQNNNGFINKTDNTEKNKSIWPLPGGMNNYINTLNEFLETVESGMNSKKELINWYINNFDNVQSEKTVDGYIFVPKSMGLVEVNNGTYFLTEQGKEYLKNRNLDYLYEVIVKNIFAFEEIIEFLKTSTEPQKEQDIFDFLNENLNANWSTFAQTNFRLLWLLNLNKILKVDGGYIVRNEE